MFFYFYYNYQKITKNSTINIIINIRIKLDISIPIGIIPIGIFLIFSSIVKMSKIAFLLYLLFTVSKLQLFKIIKFAFPIIINSIAFSTLINLGLLMVKSILIDDVLTGYFNASVTLAKVPDLLLSGVISTIIFPTISGSVKKQSLEQTKNLINKWIKLSIIIALPITFLLSFTSSKIINFFFSELYLPSSRSFSILIHGTMLLAIYNILANILKGAGKPYIPMTITSVSLILNFLLNIYLIHNY